MTDNEIIKCAENCTSDSPSCGICLYNDDRLTSSECMGELMKDLFDLTNRQKAEVERLTAQKLSREQDRDYWMAQTRIARDNIKFARSEAIKEFAERFEKKIKDVKFTIGQTWEIQCALNQTLKEMTEVSK